MAAALPRASDVVVRFRTAANRSRLPEPLRLFAYIFEAEPDQWQWYDEAYGVIAATATDSRPAQRWFGDTQFIRTVNMMTALDQLENEDPAGELPIHKVLMHYLQSHHQLLLLHPDAELQYHPALAYWVKTVILWDGCGSGLPISALRRTVVRYIKQILIELSQSHEGAPGKLPKPSVFLRDFGEVAADPKFNIQSYVSVLDKEGIPWRSWYKDVLSHEVSAPDLEKGKGEKPKGAEGFEEWYALGKGAEPTPSPRTASANMSSKAEEKHAAPAYPDESMTAEKIVELSQNAPDQAQQLLVNLPLDLASMEIINGVFLSDKANLDNTVIACNYIQHGLRKLEDSSSDGSTSTNDSDEPYSPSLDPEERKRKVKLLVLFIRNLIRRGLVPADSLQYDIQEICVRYAPIKEVRDLKHWFQTGEEL
ncbi:hypothetical protein B0J12DRAFT_255647 [Macrophomina phaseolina]|uniref:CCR4-NOT transcription complex subunit 11 n=1 Tax=Macrophomina phaseolina TaxID=35725 RepID=A0ABQ8G200_9PEZI|nr:hypothetical protein B0J12DRAFT_255647 [Macrophomina phaseolina]